MNFKNNLLSNKRSKIKKLKKLIDVIQAILQCVKDIEKVINLTKRKKREYHVRPVNRSRNFDGYFEVTFLRLKELDPQEFFIHTRMNNESYDYLLSLVKTSLEKDSIRASISPNSRLALTLLYLSQGTSIQSLAWSWKLGKSTVRAIILEVCDVLWATLSPVYVSEPNVEEFKTISSDFCNLWNMPNCVGAIDGKHIPIQCPPNSGTDYFSYKKIFSIVLLAACDAKYKFTHVDVGAYGSQNDAGIFRHSSFGSRILNKTLPLPGPCRLPNSDKVVPHYFVGDAAFPLAKNIMRPYPGRNLSIRKQIFNKRLSRARRMIENTFGILVARWRILLTTINMRPDNVERVVLACIALHNFVIDEKGHQYAPRNYCDWTGENDELHEGTWRSEVSNNLNSILPETSHHTFGGQGSTQIRENLCDYVNNEGALHWQ